MQVLMCFSIVILYAQVKWVYNLSPPTMWESVWYILSILRGTGLAIGPVPLL